MSRIFFALSFFFFSTFTYAQPEKSTTKKEGIAPVEKRRNEIKLSIFSYFSPRLEVERIIKSSLSYGIAVFHNFGSDERTLNYSLSPFFRFYLKKNKVHGANGFFIQAISVYNNFDEPFDRQPYNAIGIGAGIGKKWITERGLTLQLSLDGGRNIYIEEPAERQFLRGDISLGYRY